MRFGRVRWITLVVATVVAFPAAAQAQEPAQLGCSWAAKGNSDLLNVAFPDEEARYWLAAVTPSPGTRVRIAGEYPAARYFSFHAYDAAQRPVAGLYDRELDPDAGSVNPYRDPQASGPRRYTAYLEFGDRPAEPAPNTFYNGANPLGAVIYRIYVPNDPASETGSVALPRLVLEHADGSSELVRFAECDPTSPGTGGAVNDAINGTSFPNEAPRPLPYPKADNPPFFERAGFFTQGRVPDHPLHDAIVGSQPGFLSNLHVAYLRGYVSRQHGDVVAMRMKVPTVPDTRAGEPVDTPSQLRYWSVCMNEFVSQRFVECTFDTEAVVDEQGYATFVVADPEDRPANATRAEGINFLRWPGAYYDGLFIYRHMLPTPGFAEAVQNQKVAVPITNQMGAYGPVARYCPKQQIEQEGVASCF